MRETKNKLFNESIKVFHILGSNIDDIQNRTDDYFEKVLDHFPTFLEETKSENYPYLEKFTDQFFEVLKKIKILFDNKENISDDDITILKFFVADAMRVLEKYCLELKKGFEDKDKLIPNKKEPLKFLENWIIDRNKSPDEKDKAASKTSTKKKKSLYFTFKKGEKKFAIGLDQLVEVVNSKTIVQLPVGQDKFAGLISLRGEIVPVLNNPGENPSNKGAPEKGPKSIIVMNIDENMVGLIADATEEVIELSHDEILELETLTHNQDKNFVFYQIQEEKLFFLDIERVIAA